MRTGTAPSRLKPPQRRIGRLLVLYRSMRQIGIRTMAKETGISHATLSRIERGHAMDAETMIRLWSWLLDSETP